MKIWWKLHFIYMILLSVYILDIYAEESQPPIKGIIIGIGPHNRAWIDLGKKHKIHIGVKLQIYHKNELIGLAEAERVDEYSSEIRVTFLKENTQIQLDDIVIPIKTIRGEVIGILPQNKIWLDVGKIHGVEKDTQFMLEQDDKQIGKVKIVQVFDTSSSGIITELIEPYDVKLGDLVTFIFPQEEIAIKKDERKLIKIYSSIYTYKTKIKPLSSLLKEIIVDSKKEIEFKGDISSIISERKRVEVSDFPNISVNLGGGALTSFSYTTKGIDLTPLFKDFNLKILVKAQELNIKNITRYEESFDNYFLQNLPSFYDKQKFSIFNEIINTEKINKIYHLIGAGISFEIGNYKLSFLNYIKPPQKKQKVLYGAGIKGPYYLNLTSILPGSEEIRIEDKKLARGIDYSIDYSKGEINFTEIVSQNARILIEYNIPESHTQEPGEFTGFRIENNKKIENKFFKTDSLGFSFLQDKIIRYNTNLNLPRTLELDHTLYGLDSKILLGNYHTINFEFAQSKGEKDAKIGKFAIKHFTISDTKSQTKSPLGPYYLDEDKLPIIEGSEEVRINNQLLAQNKDYILDTQNGRLILRKEDLNLTELDDIEIRYRYLPQELLSNPTTPCLDNAYIFNLQNNFGKIKHELKISHFGKDFLHIGTKPHTTISEVFQTINWIPSQRLNLTLNRNFKKTLDDKELNIKTENETHSIFAKFELNKKNFFFL